MNATPAQDRGFPTATRWLRRLSHLSSATLFATFLVWFLAWTAVALTVIDVVVSTERQAELADIAGPLIPALGALFAFVTGFTVASDWSQHRDAEQTVGTEAGAALRLAWASQAPGLDGAAIRSDLAAYLRSVIHDEWPTLRDGPAGSVRSAKRLGALERRVRAVASDAATPPPVASDLLSSSAAVAVARRSRLVLAGHDLPVPLFALSFVSGVALALMATWLAGQIDLFTTIVVSLVAVVVALDLALVVSISAPFRGAMSVEPFALEQVLAELDGGAFGPM